MSTQNSVVRARIDGKIKADAEAVLASMGPTVSDAFRNLIRVPRSQNLIDLFIVLRIECLQIVLFRYGFKLYLMPTG
jgi:hypothetical protein